MSSEFTERLEYFFWYIKFGENSLERLMLDAPEEDDEFRDARGICNENMFLPFLLEFETV